MTIVGGGLMFVGVIGLLIGLLASHWVRHISSVTLWLTVSALVLVAGLALQAQADGWDITY